MFQFTLAVPKSNLWIKTQFCTAIPGLKHLLRKMGKIIARQNVELNGIINKTLLLHLIGFLYYLYQ